MQVTARLRVPAAAAAAPGATVTVRVADVGRADAPAVTLAESTVALDAADRDPAGDRILEVAVQVADALPIAACALSAHVDLSGTGDVSPGDLITTTHIAVRRQDADGTIDVPLVQV